jgi:hypothetical protein
MAWLAGAARAKKYFRRRYGFLPQFAHEEARAKTSSSVRRLKIYPAGVAAFGGALRLSRWRQPETDPTGGAAIGYETKVAQVKPEGRAALAVA